MSVLSTVLLVLGILMLLEGSSVVFIPKFSLRMFRRFMRSAEKNLRSWGIGEMIVALILIYLGLTL